MSDKKIKTAFEVKSIKELSVELRIPSNVFAESLLKNSFNINDVISFLYF